MITSEYKDVDQRFSREQFCFPHPRDTGPSLEIHLVVVTGVGAATVT